MNISLLQERYEDTLKELSQLQSETGDIYTPLSVVDKVLNLIPSNIFKDPSSTFLDPTAGCGAFLVGLYKKLMVSLEPIFPDANERCVHIRSKMLFAAEIMSQNAQHLRIIFGPELHIFEGDALQLVCFEHFHIRRVSVVVGNPPFSKKKCKIIGKGTLWIKLIRKTFQDWLHTDGYFAMILPPGWRRPMDNNSQTVNLFRYLTNDVSPCEVQMFTKQQAALLFGGTVRIRIDLVLFQNTPNDNTDNLTRLLCTNGVLCFENLSKWPFLPNANLDFWKNILTLKYHPTNVVHTTCYHTQFKQLVRKSDRRHKIPVVHGIRKTGPVILYSKESLQQGGVGCRKVIFNSYGSFNKPFLDVHGTYGISQSSFAMPIASKEHGELIVAFFSDRMIKRFEQDLNWGLSHSYVFWKMFLYCKKDFYTSQQV
jgi:hypothetical protein